MRWGDVTYNQCSMGFYNGEYYKKTKLTVFLGRCAESCIAEHSWSSLQSLIQNGLQNSKRNSISSCRKHILPVECSGYEFIVHQSRHEVVFGCLMLAGCDEQKSETTVRRTYFHSFIKDRTLTVVDENLRNSANCVGSRLSPAMLESVGSFTEIWVSVHLHWPLAANCASNGLICRWKVFDNFRLYHYHWLSALVGYPHVNLVSSVGAL